jgi:serine/threonine protein kinase
MPETASSLVGTTIGGRYHLVRQLGDGGMGAVFKAADQVLRRFVAVKLLHKTTAMNPAAVERFVREARSSAAIGHPNIIDVIDFGDDRGHPFLVMEYLKGQPLSQVIALEAPFRVSRAASIAAHALAGLAAAHARGILHRDLKPANLMLVSRLGDRDFVKVCDFGFATLLAPKTSIHDGKSLTPARTLVGTPAYAAPERLRGDDRPDARVDVYAMGVVLFEMLAGRRPFDAPTFAELAQKVRNDPAPLLSSIRKETPPGLDEVVARALAKEREKRWPSAEMFAAALVPYGGRRVDDVTSDDDPSDVFTMDVLRLRARETEHKRTTLTGEHAPIAVRTGKGTTTDRGVIAPRASNTESEPGKPRSAGSLDIQVSIDDSWTGDVRALYQTSNFEEPARATLVEMPHPSSRPPPAGPLDPNRAVAGSLVLSTLRFVQTRFGPRAMRDVLTSLSPESADIFQRGVAATDYVPLVAFESLTQGIDAKLGSDDMQLLVSCGRAAGEALVSLFRENPATTTVETTLVDLPRVVGRGFRGISLRSRTIGRGYGTVEVVDEEEHTLGTCVTMLGLVEQCVGSTHARDLEVSCVSCTALGDSECLMHISWFTS